MAPRNSAAQSPAVSVDGLTPSSRGKLPSKEEIAADAKVHIEFGGAIGALLFMLFSPAIMYYFWLSVDLFDCSLARPTGFTAPELIDFANRMWQHTYAHAFPTVYATQMYLGLVLFQAVVAVVLPGPIVKGLPLPSENGRQLSYLCNGVACWYATLLVSAVLHFTGVLPLTDIVDHFGPLMSVAVLFGFFVTFAVFIAAYISGTTYRMSGNLIYDLFMGASLNPHVGPLDLKMWAEIRVPWVLLFYVSLSAFVKVYAVHGFVSTSFFMVLAHFLYVNACHKGEECIPTTWDIFYEKWGFMLIFWNLAGVPFTYCLPTLYLLKKAPVDFHPAYTASVYALLLFSYWMWDTANSQKNRFRMQLRGTFVARNTFPQLPWGTLVNPAYVKTRNGSLLLADGWYKYGRKMHYTADLLMALSWGLITGFGAFLPYWYFCFFLLVLTHRVTRDQAKCSKKYGDDWKEFCRRVPYIFIPGVF